MIPFLFKTTCYLKILVLQYATLEQQRKKKNKILSRIYDKMLVMKTIIVCVNLLIFNNNIKKNKRRRMKYIIGFDIIFFEFISIHMIEISKSYIN
jgi:hypothetical protein